MFKNISISKKLVIMTTLMGIVPLVIVAAVIKTQVDTTLREESFKKLEAIKTIKQNQLDTWFREQFMVAEMLTESADVHLSLNNFKAYYHENAIGEAENYPVDTDSYAAIWEENASFLQAVQKKFHFYDIFIISTHGHVMYSNTKESDLGENLKYGDLKSSGLGQVWAKTMQTGSSAIVDFTLYAPSNGDPAIFIASPIQGDSGNTVGILAVQLSDKAIGNITQERTGMGDTGETYLIGMDKRMRSNSFLDPKGHSLVASLTGSIKENGVDTEAAREIINGKSGAKEILDYNGNPVLSVYSPFIFNDLKWGLIAEIDVAEALASEFVLLKRILILTIVFAILIAAASYYFSMLFSRPIRYISDELKHASDNADLTRRVTVRSQDELGVMGSSLNQFVEKVSTLISESKDNAQNVSSAAAQISAATEELAKTVEEQNEQSQSVGAAAEELSATSNDIAESVSTTLLNAEEASKITRDGGEVIEESMNSFDIIKNKTESLAEIIGNLDESTQEISSILEVINDIADQTNLLALNAAIEAARAGEAGRGFAVVADEVRKLAERTGTAINDVENIIVGLQKESNMATESMSTMVKEVENGASKAQESIGMLNQIVGGSDEIVSATNSIAAAISQQNATIEEISQSIQGIAFGAQESANAISQSAATAEDLARQSEDLMQNVSVFKTD